MMRKLVIFGTGEIAQLAHYYFENDSDYDVVAFTVDEAYLTDREFCGLPVVAFENVADRYPPADHALFVALSAKSNPQAEVRGRAGSWLRPGKLYQF
jgi:hypothetical protein